MLKVAIIQRIIPHYRIDFFNNLYSALKDYNINLRIFHSDRTLMKTMNHFKYIKPSFYINFPFLFKTTFFISFGIWKELKKFNPDLIITEDISNLPNGILVLLYSKLFQVKYGIFGLGKILFRQNQFLSKVLKGVFYSAIEIFRNNSSFFLSYSSFGANYYRNNYHNPSYPIYNSICNPSNNLSYSTILQKYRQAQTKILFMGSIERFKRLSILLDTIRILRDLPLKLVIIGEGSLSQDLKKNYRDLQEIIVWKGRITKNFTKEKIFREIHLGIMPGSGGLAIQEMSANGIPVITSYSDGTEIDMVKSKNPELFLEKIGTKTLANKIQQFMFLSEDSKANLAFNAYNVTKEVYNLSNMISKTVEAILNEI